MRDIDRDFWLKVYIEYGLTPFDPYSPNFKYLHDYYKRINGEYVIKLVVEPFGENTMEYGAEYFDKVGEQWKFNQKFIDEVINAK